jgi:HSP20 family protein
MTEQNQLTARDSRALTPEASRTGRRSHALIPAVDIYEDNLGITLLADMPGVSREQLEVRVQDGTLFLEGEVTLPTPAELRLQHLELREPRFARAFALSQDFDTSKIDASLTDGVLKLTIPRRDEARPRRIDVRID